MYAPPSKARRDAERGGGEKQQSRVSSLLEAVDLENVLEATRPPLPVEALPGGSVSFLFERTSKTPLDEETPLEED